MTTSLQITPRETAPQTDSPRRAVFIHFMPRSEWHIELAQADWYLNELRSFQGSIGSGAAAVVLDISVCRCHQRRNFQWIPAP
jgi:hypothetical protein